MLKLYVKEFTADNIVATWEGDGSLKHEIINDDYLNVIVGKIKNRKPDAIEFKSTQLDELIREELVTHEIYINSRGKVFYDEATGYNKLDKELESSNVFELIVSHAYNRLQAQILDESGYTYEMTKLEDNKVRFIVNPWYMY